VTSSFDGLLDPSTYAYDEPVRIAADEAEFWVSERVWNRLWHMGCAYDLHLLKLLDGGSDVVTLNAIQAAALIDELAFVRTVTTDGILTATIEEVGDLAQRADLAPFRSVAASCQARGALFGQSVRVLQAVVANTLATESTVTLVSRVR
jgi:hypothetical protein